jgi:hypothetical protein
VLGKLVGDSAEGWGRVQEHQARMQDKNRKLVAESRKHKDMLRTSLSQLGRATWSDSDLCSSSDAPSQAMSAAASTIRGHYSVTPQLYQTANQRFFGHHDPAGGSAAGWTDDEVAHFADMRERARGRGFGKYAHITMWGQSCA